MCCDNQINFDINVKNDIFKKYEQLKQSEIDENIGQKILKYLVKIEKTSGFESVLVGRVLALSNVIRTSSNIYCKQCANAALEYLMLEEDCIPDHLPEGLEDDSFIISYAINEICKILGENLFDYEGGISEEEQQRCVDYLDSINNRDNKSINELEEIVLEFCSEMKPIGKSPFLSTMIAKLLDILEEAKLSFENNINRYKLASSAIQYLHEVNDVIPDDLGLPGYLDDKFVIDLVHWELFGSTKWADLTNCVVHKYPFLREIHFAENGVRYPVSNLINGLISIILKVNNSQSQNEKVAICVNDSSYFSIITATIYSIIASAEFVSNNSMLTMNRNVMFPVLDKSGVKNLTFSFTGINENGTHFFLSTKGNESTHELSIESIWCLSPSNKNLSRNKKLKFPKLGNRIPKRFGVLDRILNLNFPAHLVGYQNNSYLVSSFKNIACYSEALKIHGESLFTSIPIDKVYRDKFANFLSDNFKRDHWGETPPILSVINSISDINIFEKKHRDNKIEDIMSFVDYSQIRSINKYSELKGHDGKTIVFVNSSDINDIDKLKSIGIPVISLDGASIKQLIPLSSDNCNKISIKPLLTECELSLANLNKSIINIHVVKLTSLKKASEIYKLLYWNNLKFEDIEYKTILYYYGILISLLTKQIFELESDIETYNNLQRLCGKIEGVIDSAHYSTELMDNINKFYKLCKEGLEILYCSNPKKDLIKELLFHDKSLPIRIVSDVEPAELFEISNKECEFISTGSVLNSDFTKSYNLVLPFMPKIKNSGKFLINQKATETNIILYDFEFDRCLNFYNKIKSQNKYKAKCVKDVLKIDSSNNASDIGTEPFIKAVEMHFAQKSHCVKKEVEEHNNSLLDSVEDLAGNMSLELLKSKNRTIRDSKQVLSKFLILRNDAFIPMSPNHKVTKIYGVNNNDLKSDVINASELNTGDCFIYYNGSEQQEVKDLVNDRLGETHKIIREDAAIWQYHLKSFYSGHCLCSINALKKKLSEIGCYKNILTLKKWVESDDLSVGPSRESEILGYLSELFKRNNYPQVKQYLSGMDRCLLAIRTLRAEHLKVGRLISKFSIDNELPIEHQGNAKFVEKFKNLEEHHCILEISEIIDDFPVSGYLLNRICSDLDLVL